MTVYLLICLVGFSNR